MIFRFVLYRLNQTNVVLRFVSTIILLFAATQAIAADHFVAASTTTVNCGTFGGGVKPGDTITLAAGNRGPLTIRNCAGTSSNPIIIRNDTGGSGPTVIRRTTASSGGFVFTCRDCSNVIIDGTGRWKGAPQGAYCGAPAGTNGCGIKITSVVANDAPSAYLKLNGLTTKTTVRGVEVDGRWSDLKTAGVGIDLNDHSITVAGYPDFWREALVYEMNYIHDVGNSGLYIGPNWSELDPRVPLRNITIRKNLVENTGRDGMKLKSAIAGINRIHGNVIRRCGLKGEPNFGTGIAMFEGGSNAKIHHNLIESPAFQGIQHYNSKLPASKGPFKSDIYNNVVFESGRLWVSAGTGHGITVASASGSAQISPTIYNNTVVKSGQAGINFNSRVSGGVVRDNIVAEWGTRALSIGDNLNINNRTGTISSIRFVDARGLNFALASDSPAVNSGSNSGFPSDDFLRTLRPQGNKSDQGAFEFSSGLARPRSPTLTGVQ